MRKYVVIKFFTDLQDNNTAYNVGDSFPRNGLKVSEDRFKELAGRNNRQGCPLIRAINVENTEEAPKRKQTGRRGRKKSDAE